MGEWNNSSFKFKDLTVYKKAFGLSMEIFNVTKKFPSEEKYVFPVKLGDLLVLFVHQLEKVIEKEDMKHIL